MPANTTTDAAAFSNESYDILIVGGGTAGLALATRLSEDTNITVGVLEAGPDLCGDPMVASAGGWLATTYGPQYSWGFSTEPQTAASGQKMPLPRGKLLGGCSAMNAMMWTRASRQEYDALSTTFGSPGWSFDTLLPYFKKSQAHTPQDNDILPGTARITTHQGTDGPIKTSYNTWYSSLIKPVAAAIANLGFKINEDPNGGDATGFMNIARAVDGSKGTRQHSGVTYLEETSGRSNISVLLGARATKIAFSGAFGDLTATGVEYDAGGAKFIVNATKQVVLSAGAYQTPQLLELSGIGKPAILNQYGIGTKVDLPVGENLQDHLMLSLNFVLTPDGCADLKLVPTADARSEPGLDAQSTSTGGPFLFAPLKAVADPNAHAELVKLLDSYLASEGLSHMERTQFKLQREWLADDRAVPDAEVMYANLPGAVGLPLPDGTMTLWLPVSHLHPTSRGSVHIGSADPLAPPVIDHKFLTRSYDLKALMEVVRFAQKITKTEPLAGIIAGGAVPGPDVQTDEQLEVWVKKNISTVFHPVGTAPLAPKEIGGVVDPNLKVYGTKNLRVVDASVIPLQLGATPMATVYAIAERAADIIKAEF